MTLTDLHSYTQTHTVTHTDPHSYTQLHIQTTWLHTQTHMVTYLGHISHWSKSTTSPAPLDSIADGNSEVWRIPHVP